MKRILMVAVLAVVAISCNKNQAAVKKLDGTWMATEVNYTSGGTTTDLMEEGLIDSYQAVFDGCKLKDDEFCNVTYTIETPFGTDTEADLYRVTDDGETFEAKDDASSSTINSSMIVELTGSNLTLRTDEGDDESTEIKMEKQ